MYYLCTGNKEACKGERTRFMYLEELFSGKKKKVWISSNTVQVNKNLLTKSRLHEYHPHMIIVQEIEAEIMGTYNLISGNSYR